MIECRRFLVKICILSICLLSISSWAEKKDQLITISKIYICHYTKDKIKIDGISDELCWQKAKILIFFVPVTLEKPLSKTEAKLLWDKNFLYVSFKAYDKDIWGYFKNRDDATCGEDVLEIFIKTHPDKEPYYNFEINALKTVYDAFNIKRGPGSHRRWAKWNCKGLKCAIKIEGELNNWDEEDAYWSMEVAIPFSSLPTLIGKSPTLEDNWLFHLARYDYSVYLPKWRELTSCASLSKVDFHLYEDWSTLKFDK